MLLTCRPSLLLVHEDIILPIPAKAGQYLAWYPAQDITVVVPQPDGSWLPVRSLGYDAAGAIEGLEQCGTITQCYVPGVSPVAEDPQLPSLPPGHPRADHADSAPLRRA